MKVLLAGLCVGIVAACVATQAGRPLATAEYVSDFESYSLRRVGLVPFSGATLSADQAQSVQSAFFTEISHATRLEVVPLSSGDLDEVPTSDPFRRGRYEPRTVIHLARRYNLDALLVGTVTELVSFPPQRLSVQVDLVAAETGLVVWSSSIHLDARNEDVRRAIQARYQNDEAGGENWDVTLLSPRRFAQFAAYEIARLL